MFSKLKNIETAFQHVRLFSYLLLQACILISGFALYQSYRMVQEDKQRIYILADGKALEAFAGDRKINLPVEARDHIRTFLADFFTLDPDDKVIEANVSKALYLADGSAKSQYDNLKEKGYYANLISANISQQLTVDSIALDMNRYPFYFKCYATQKLVRATSTTFRELVSEGYLRNVNRSDNNPHGFLIERWTLLENQDKAREGGP